MKKFNLTIQGQQAFVKALEITNGSTISTQDIILAFAETFDTSAGRIMLREKISSRMISRELKKAKLVDEHPKNIFVPSTDDGKDMWSFAEFRNKLENYYKSSPVCLINETGSSEVMLVDRKYHITDYLLSALEYGQELCIQKGFDSIETVAILLGMLDNEDSNAFFVMLKLLEVTQEISNDPYTNNVYNAFSFWNGGYYYDGYFSNQKKDEKDKANKLINRIKNPNYSILDHFGTDLTQLAIENKIAPVIGREKEISRLGVILNRRQKSNAILVGPAGVGKTAIAEGLAIKIAHNDLPALTGRKLVEIKTENLGLLFQNISPEGLAHHLVNELSRDRDKILFIDEIQLLRMYGYNRFINIIKPGLARGDFQIIGATTPAEAESFFYGDEALKRRFEIIGVTQPTQEQADKILSNSINSYENYYHANYTDSALKLAVDLANTYLQSSLPDSAFTIIDNAGALFVTDRGKQPKTTFSYIKKLKQLRKKLEIAKMKSLNDSEINALKQQINTFNEQILKAKNNSTKHNYDNVVDTSYIIRAVESMIQRKVPASKIAQLKKSRLVASEDVMTLASRLKQNVIGQDEAINELVKAVAVSKAGLRKPGSPVGSYFFAGLTGVGKTELAKQLATELYGSVQHLARFNMAEYSGMFAVEKLKYAIYYQMTKDSNCCLLFDEIEKASPEVFKLFLSIMDDGSFMSSLSMPLDFSKSTIIFTSNIGADTTSSIGFGTSDEIIKNDAILTSMSCTFALEFINRLTKVVVFNQLKQSDLIKITNLLLKKKAQLMKEKGITFQWDNALTKYVVQRFADYKYGARPLERGIDQLMAEELAKLIITNKVSKGSKVFATIVNNKMLLNVEG